MLWISREGDDLVAPPQGEVEDLAADQAGGAGEADVHEQF